MKGNVLKPSGMYTENGVYLQTEYKPETDKPKTEQADTMTKIITKARFSNNCSYLCFQLPVDFIT
jgi:hypothetical protein